MQRIKLTNAADIIRAQHGHLAPELIRSIEVDALIDTQVSTLILPADVADQVGFDQAGMKKTRLADGSLPTRPLR